MEFIKKSLEYTTSEFLSFYFSNTKRRVILRVTENTYWMKTPMKSGISNQNCYFNNGYLFFICMCYNIINIFGLKFAFSGEK